MANVQAVEQKSNMPSLYQMVNNSTVKARFNEVLGKQAGTFIGALISLTNSNERLRECNPQTVLSAAMTAATLKLPINPNLGFAYMVPYRNKGKMECSFQLGWHGFVQLAMRSGQYQRINVTPVYDGEIKGIDFITGDIERGERKSDTIVGYIAFFRLVNGFEKSLYMTVEELRAHAQKYSQTYRNGYGVWVDNFDAMARKTVLKLLISRFGIMSIDMQGSDMATALAADQAVVKDSRKGDYDYVDNQPEKDDGENASRIAQNAPESLGDGKGKETIAQGKKDAQKPTQEEMDDAILGAALDEELKKSGLK